MSTRIDARERKALTIVKVGEPQNLPNSQVKVLRFSCSDGLTYETFKQSLFPYIKLNATIDADTELHITTSANGVQYVHWRVTQIYTSGKPVLSEKWGRRSPEEAQDIRRQVAIKEIGECWRNGKFTDDSPFVIAYKTWLLSALNIEVSQPQKLTVK